MPKLNSGLSYNGCCCDSVGVAQCGFCPSLTKSSLNLTLYYSGSDTSIGTINTTMTYHTGCFTKTTPPATAQDNEYWISECMNIPERLVGGFTLSEQYKRVVFGCSDSFGTTPPNVTASLIVGSAAQISDDGGFTFHPDPSFCASGIIDAGGFGNCKKFSSSDGRIFGTVLSCDPLHVYVNNSQTGDFTELHITD